MTCIYFNLHGSLTSGGPTVAAARLASGFAKKGHTIIYDNPAKANVCLCIIESGKTLRKVNRNKTKVVVRLDGAYFKNYWHSKTPDRMWRSDMTALHAAIKRDVENADHMIYQSQFSKNMIDAEIAERKSNFSIIHNGIDVSLFIPRSNAQDGFIHLFHHGVVRNDYIMNSLLGVYDELSKTHKIKLTIVGSLDAQCSTIFKKRSDANLIHIPQINNSALPPIFSRADIGIYPRQGSSCDNSVIEALSSGVPVVVPSFGGNSEMIVDGQEGMIIDSNNWDYGESYIKKLANGVEYIMRDLDGFKTRARDSAVKNLDINIMIDKYLKAMGI